MSLTVWPIPSFDLDKKGAPNTAQIQNCAGHCIRKRSIELCMKKRAPSAKGRKAEPNAMLTELLRSSAERCADCTAKMQAAKLSKRRAAKTYTFFI
eukprot:6185878-Pleurochrysis_carterae.AAC.1